MKLLKKIKDFFYKENKYTTRVEYIERVEYILPEHNIDNWIIPEILKKDIIIKNREERLKKLGIK